MARRKNIVTTLQNASAQTTSRLFKIPPELRNRIYELVFEDQITRFDSKSPLNSRGVNVVPGLLMTCKYVYSEALQVFFSTTRFEFENKGTLNSWPCKIGPQNRSVVSRVDFRIRPSDFWLKFRMDKDDHDKEKTKLIQFDAILRGKGVKIRPGMLRIRCQELWGSFIWRYELGEDGMLGIVFTK